MDEIDNQPSLETIQEITQKKFIFYSKKLKIQKTIYDTINIFSLLLVLVGSITGLIIHNDIILGVLNSFGLLIQGFLRLKNYQKKINLLSIISDQYYMINNSIELYKNSSSEFNYSVLTNRIKTIDNLSAITLSSEDLFL